MLNWRAADLDAAVADLRDAGLDVEVLEEAADYGRCARTEDPEGNGIELWEPPDA